MKSPDKNEIDVYRSGAMSSLAFLREHESFLLATHPYPDGDAIGSMLALAGYLRREGKKCTGILFSRVPERYAFLEGSDEILVFPEGTDRDYDALVCLDIGSIDRIGDLLDELSGSLPIINIDHHLSNPGFGTVDWNASAASSVGEMLYDMFTFADIEISQAMADALYTSIVTDTGRFSFQNTSARTLMAAANLVAAGTDASGLCRRIFEHGSHPRLKLLASSLNSIKTSFNDQMSWMCITQNMYRATGTTMADSYEFIDMLKSVAGTRIAVLFREHRDGRTKISVRTDSSVSADALCKNFAGGGHRCAAGALIDAPITKAVQMVTEAAGPLLENINA